MMNLVLFATATFVGAVDPYLAMATTAIEAIPNLQDKDKKNFKDAVTKVFAVKAAYESKECDGMRKAARALLDFANLQIEQGTKTIMDSGLLDAQMKIFIEMGKNMILPQFQQQVKDFVEGDICDELFGEAGEKHDEF